MLVKTLVAFVSLLAVSSVPPPEAPDAINFIFHVADAERTGDQVTLHMAPTALQGTFPSRSIFMRCARSCSAIGTEAAQVERRDLEGVTWVGDDIEVKGVVDLEDVTEFMGVLTHSQFGLGDWGPTERSGLGHFRVEIDGIIMIGEVADLPDRSLRTARLSMSVKGSCNDFKVGRVSVELTRGGSTVSLPGSAQIDGSQPFFSEVC